MNIPYNQPNLYANIIIACSTEFLEEQIDRGTPGEKALIQILEIEAGKQIKALVEELYEANN